MQWPSHQYNFHVLATYHRITANQLFSVVHLVDVELLAQSRRNHARNGLRTGPDGVGDIPRGGRRRIARQSTAMRPSGHSEDENANAEVRKRMHP